MWDGRDQINLIRRYEGNNRTRTQNKHDRDERRRDNHRLSNRFGWTSAFASENGDILKSTQCTEPQFAKNIEAKERKDRHRRSERMIFPHLASGDMEHWQNKERAENGKHDDAPRIVKPFTYAQPNSGNDDKERYHEKTGQGDQPFVRRNPGTGGADCVGEIRRQL